MYDDYVLASVIKAFLVEGKSHRVIQREILGIPAPSRGGGFKTMEILHGFNIKGDKKGAFKNKEILYDSEISNNAINLLKQLIEEEKEAENFIPEHNEINKNNLPTEKDGIIKIRVFQNKLRKVVLNNYGNKCALCDIDQDDLLVCSHIIPWSEDHENRLNPRNAISMCVLHDKLFDKGYFYLDENFRIVTTERCNDVIRKIMSNSVFRLPANGIPDIELLKYRIPID